MDSQEDPQFNNHGRRREEANIGYVMKCSNSDMQYSSQGGEYFYNSGTNEGIWERNSFFKQQNEKICRTDYSKKKKKRRKIVFDQVANRKPFVVLNKKKTII